MKEVERMSTPLTRLRGILHAGDAALVTAPQNLRYFTGFPSGESYLAVFPDAAYFLTDSRYIEMAQRTVAEVQCRQIGMLTAVLRELCDRHGATTLYVETEHTTVGEAARLRDGLGGGIAVSEATLLDTHTAQWRSVKRDGEVRCIERAQAIVEAAFEHICGFIREGVTEREVALELEYYMLRHGAQAVAFDTIAVAGVNGSLPHGIPSDKPLCRGELLTMDYGAVVDGYHSDMTRTVAIGEISAEQRRIYDTVLAAQEAALAVLRAGVSCVEGDAAARRVIAEAGYGEYFGHGTGHGVGLEIHEQPRLSPRSAAVLQAGHVVTVEPGIYVPAVCGVRIEDMVLITEDGCRNLTHSPKQLLCL